MQHRITKLQYNSKYCFVCGLENEMGLKARFYETENKELVAVFTPRLKHQSYPNRLHGGISTAMLDETIGRAICIHYGDMVWGVTLDLDIKFRKPVPYEVELKVIGRITEDRGRIFEGTGELLLPGGEIAVTAKGRYMKMTVEKIAGSDFVDGQWGYIADDEIPETLET